MVTSVIITVKTTNCANISGKNCEKIEGVLKENIFFWSTLLTIDKSLLKNVILFLFLGICTIGFIDHLKNWYWFFFHWYIYKHSKNIFCKMFVWFLKSNITSFSIWCHWCIKPSPGSFCWCICFWKASFTCPFYTRVVKEQYS